MVSPPHIESLGPGLATGGWITKMETALVAAGQDPDGLLEVSVRFTVPVLIDGVYIAVTEVVSENVPPLSDVQTTEVVAPP